MFQRKILPLALFAKKNIVPHTCDGFSTTGAKVHFLFVVLLAPKSTINSLAWSKMKWHEEAPAEFGIFVWENKFFLHTGSLSNIFMFIILIVFLLWVLFFPVKITSLLFFQFQRHGGCFCFWYRFQFQSRRAPPAKLLCGFLFGRPESLATSRNCFCQFSALSFRLSFFS